MKKYKAKGDMIFRLESGDTQWELLYDTYNINDIVAERLSYRAEDKELRQYFRKSVQEEYTDEVYDLIDGLEFAKSVEESCFMDYDGSIVAIYVDGYKSNLGIFSTNLKQGLFLLSLDAFKEICANHKIEVNWANR